MTLNKTVIRVSAQIVLAVLAFLLILKILPAIHPLPQTHFEITQLDAEDRATEFLKNEIPLNKLKIKSRFKITQEYLQQPDNAELMGKDLGFQPYKYWEIEMYSREMKTSDLFLGSDEDESARRYTEKWYKINLSPEGQVLKIDFETARLKFYEDSLKNLPQSILNDRGKEESMRQTALIFLQEIGKDTSKLEYQGSELNQDSLALIYNTKFTQKINQSSYQHQVKLTSSGILLVYDFKITSAASKEETGQNVWLVIYEITAGLIYLVLVVLIIVFLIYFARKESISFKIGFPFVFIIFFLTAVGSLFELWHTSLALILLGVLFTSLLYSIGMLILYSVCDPMARQQWRDKLVVTDLIRKGSLFNRLTALGILRGIFLGVLSLAGYAAIIFIYRRYFNGNLRPGDGLEYSFTVILPVLAIVFSLLKKAIFNELYFRLLGISFLRRKFSRNLTWILGSLLLTYIFSVELKAENLLVHYISAFIPASLFVGFFIRYDVFTTLIGYFTYYLLEKAVIFSTTPEQVFNEIGTGSYVSLAILLIFGTTTLYFKRNDSDKIQEYIPDYMRTLQERERLLRELEIARSVQLKFLPNYTPQIPNFEIAAFCQPAWEVGGDYYDFFKLDNNRWGIAIGDVSNKGVSAAFYMTMVKGFLKATTKHHNKPKDILVESNTLFYENVERGHFISMIFGILDHQKSEFIFSRAGHNPLLLLVDAATEGRWLTPEGMGIGLAPSEVFRSTIGEQTIQFRAGDTLVLYTDGYPEAMNVRSEEFGEKNLENLIKEHIHRSPREIISMLEEKIKEWEGNQTSLDDRTIIVIKHIS
ncbi:MAG: SpoIIE family protein phosphatase [bacterium]|nr:MAG: SpoIIE family protein phosphatase [bacterium]